VNLGVTHETPIEEAQRMMQTQEYEGSVNKLSVTTRA
jgi:hypothetical protein